MQFAEMGNMNGKTLMLLLGTACDYQTNFVTVLLMAIDEFMEMPV